MFEYVLTAMVGAALASIMFLVARLLNQQKEQFNALKGAIDKQLDTIRQDAVKERQRTDKAAANLQNLQQSLDRAIAARAAVDTTPSDAIKDLGKKLDEISAQISEQSAQPKVTTRARYPRYGWPGGFGGGTLDEIYKGFGQSGQVSVDVEGHGNLAGSVPSISVDPDILQTTIPGISPHIRGYYGKGFSNKIPDIFGKDIWFTDPAGTNVTADTSDNPPPSAPTPSEPASSAPASPKSEAAPDEGRLVDLMFATTRKYDDAQERFTGERSPTITFGQAWIRVPEHRKPGELNRPTTYSLLSYTVYRQKEDPKKHFVLRGATILPKEGWLETIGSMPQDDALVFVHGFNNSFEDALYRNAQIVWDLGFKGIKVLFSWPSRGAVQDYGYDRESALGARIPFIEILESLASQSNVKRIHILAHSMGNMVVLDALNNRQTNAAPLKLGQLIMAAPDVDRDLYKMVAVAARRLTEGMTLYASAADKALFASKHLAGAVPRAGDVPEDGPIVIENIDSIDATALGEEMFGLNHSTYASSLSILNDVYLLLKGQPLRRVLEMASVPEGVVPPKYWRYITGRG